MATFPLTSDIWTWFNEPVAFRSGNYTYHGVLNDTGVVGVARYDHTNQIIQVGNPRGTSSLPIQVDDHNNPAVIRLNSGRIFCALTEHVGACWSCVTTATDGDVMGTWTQTQIQDGVTYFNAYAHLCETSDDQHTLFWFFRNSVGATSPAAFRINQNDGAGGSWTANASIVNLISETGQRPYFRIAQSGLRIDIIYNNGNPIETSDNSLWHVYMLLNQAGTQFGLYKSDGTLIDTWAITGGTGIVNSVTLPIATTAGTKIYNGNPNRSWVWDAQWIGGTLYGCYAVFTQTSVADDTHQYFRCKLSGGTWTSEAICYAGDSTVSGTVGRTPQWIPPDAAPLSNTIYSPGVCLDPGDANTAYTGKKFGNADIRILKWTGSGGTWTYSSDVSGANGLINARPFPVAGSSPSDVIWWTGSAYTNYTAYTALIPRTLQTYSLARTTKISTPVWTSSYGPPGVKAFYLITEGTGTAVADATGTYNGTINGGTLTWGTDSYGANLSGFSSTVAVIADALAASGSFDSAAAYPRWIYVLFKRVSSTTLQYLAGFGLNTADNPIFAVNIFPTGGWQVGGITRDNASGSNSLQGTQTMDTAYHTIMLHSESASLHRLFFDGQYKANGTTALGTTTFTRFTIGALRRTTQSVPATDCTISAVVVGAGSLVNPIHAHNDAIQGQFLGTWAPSVSTFAPWLYMPEENICG
jgi:hypothetical protein